MKLKAVGFSGLKEIDVIQIAPNFCIGLPDYDAERLERFHTEVMKRRKDTMNENGYNIKHLPSDKEWEDFKIEWIKRRKL